MRYYLIAGEASGDLHASELMRSIKNQDASAQFRYLGGAAMAAVDPDGQAQDYRKVAYMGFIPVILHLKTILAHMAWCRKDIAEWKPDVLILVDYPGFNLKIASYVHSHTNIPVVYYISPKIWAWKEFRIRQIRRDVDAMLCILPFEKEFYEMKHHYPIRYVGNPTWDEVRRFKALCQCSREQFLESLGLEDRPLVALLAGSRLQEIKDNLPRMLAVSRRHPEYQFLLAGAPGIEKSCYDNWLDPEKDQNVRLLFSRTYEILSHSRAALVTSGTATLETALFGVPQAVCYYFRMGALVRQLKKLVLSVKYISLVNLIAGHEVVRELIGDLMNVDRMERELDLLIKEGSYRREMQRGYEEVAERLGQGVAPDEAAREILGVIRKGRR